MEAALLKEKQMERGAVKPNRWLWPMRLIVALFVRYVLGNLYPLKVAVPRTEMAVAPVECTGPCRLMVFYEELLKREDQLNMRSAELDKSKSDLENEAILLELYRAWSTFIAEGFAQELSECLEREAAAASCAPPPEVPGAEELLIYTNQSVKDKP